MASRVDNSPRARRASRSSGRVRFLTLIGAASLGLAVGPGCGGGHRAPEADPTSVVDDAQLDASQLRARLDATLPLVDARPTDPYPPHRVAELHHRLGQLAHAEDALLVALARDESYAPALSLLSKLYFEAGRHEAAIAMLENASSSGNHPEGVPQELLAGLALHYDAIGELERAEGVVERLLLEGADWSDCGSAIAYVKLRGDGYKTAADVAELAMRADAESATNLNNYGITRAQAGDPEGARAAFEEATRKDPELAGAYYNLAILEKFYFLDDEKAAHWFGEYWRRSQDDPDELADLFGYVPGEDDGSLAVREDSP